MTTPTTPAATFWATFRVVLVGKLFGLHIVRLNLSANHSAIALAVLRLDDGNRMRITPRTSSRRKGERQYCRTLAAEITHSHAPLGGHQNVHLMFYATDPCIASNFSL
jgi:hypothetical protein